MKKSVRYSKGFTVVELIVVLFLTASIMAIGAKVFFAAETSFKLLKKDTEQAMESRQMAEHINTAIRYTNALFTIPKGSFNYDNLTYSWSYLGIMDNVTVPAAASHTGSSLTGQSAIVYIRFVGDTEPTNLNPRETALNYDGGWFVQTVIGYSHKDPETALDIKYSLVFNPADESGNIAGTAVQYDFKSECYDEEGNKVGDYTDLNISSMLNGLNTLQVVYQGSSDNPATAIAFHEGGFDLDVTVGQPKANIVMVLDVSGSMAYSISGKNNNSNERLKAMKQNAKTFISSFAYNTVTFGIVPFSTQGSNSLPINTGDNQSALSTAINALTANGSTNLGDGIRHAYYKFKEMPNKDCENFLVIITDGEYNLSTHLLDATEESYWNWFLKRYETRWVWEDFTMGNFYWGEGKTRSLSSNQKVEVLDSQSSSYGKAYMEFTAGKFDGTEFKKPTVYLINIKDLSDASAKAVMDAFGVAEMDYNKYIFKVNDSQSFVDSIGNVVDQINNSAWLLDGPKM